MMTCIRAGEGGWEGGEFEREEFRWALVAILFEETIDDRAEEDDEEEENQCLPIDDQTNACPVCHKVLIGDNNKKKL